MFEQLYLDRGSALHNLDLWTKVVCLLISIPVAALLGQPWVLISLIVCLSLLLGLSRVKPGTFWRQIRLYLVLITVATMTLSLFFAIGDWWSRVLTGLVLSTRFTVLVASGILFVMITNPTEIPVGMCRIGIPHRYGIAVMVGHRMTPLLTAKLSNVVAMQRARGARFSLSISGIPRLMRELFSLVIPSLILTLEISVDLADALLARGYDPSAPTITVPPSRLKTTDAGIALLSAVLLGLAIWSRL